MKIYIPIAIAVLAGIGVYIGTHYDTDAWRGAVIGALVGGIAVPSVGALAFLAYLWVSGFTVS